MHNEMNQVSKVPKYKELDFPHLAVDEQAEKWWKYNLKRDDSPIVDLFGGQLMSRITCKYCHFESLAFDNFLDLSVDMPSYDSKISLEDCLEEFIKSESMEEKYEC